MASREHVLDTINDLTRTLDWQENAADISHHVTATANRIPCGLFPTHYMTTSLINMNKGEYYN